MKRYWSYTLTTAVLAAWIHPGLSATFLQDGFAYPDGAVTEAPGSAWTAHSQAGNGPVMVVNGQLQLHFDGAEDISAPLAGAPHEADGAVQALYAGFKLTVSALPSESGSYLAHFRNRTTAHRGRIWISQTDAAEGMYRLGIGNSGGASATSGPWPTDLSPGTPYRVVIRYDLETGLSTLWVDAANEAAPSVTASDEVGLTDLSYYSFRQNGDIGVIHVDELQVADSFAEVVSQGVPLQLHRSAEGVRVSWPLAAEDYTLQRTLSLTPAQWADVPDVPSTEGQDKVLLLPKDQGEAYFRLIKP